jgi:hypothetical protein
MKYGRWLIRTMKMSEHTKESWIDIFEVEDDKRRNYAVVDWNTNKLVDDQLTFTEAKSYAEQLQWEDMEFELEYDVE